MEFYEIECFWCEKIFDGSQYDRCPDCASDLQTGSIKIIGEEE